LLRSTGAAPPRRALGCGAGLPGVVWRAHAPTGDFAPQGAARPSLRSECCAWPAIAETGLGSAQCRGLAPQAWPLAGAGAVYPVTQAFVVFALVLPQVIRNRRGTHRISGRAAVEAAESPGLGVGHALQYAAERPPCALDASIPKRNHAVCGSSPVPSIALAVQPQVFRPDGARSLCARPVPSWCGTG